MLAKVHAARLELAKRAKSPLVAAAQLDGALLVTDQAIAELDAVVRTLAIAVLDLAEGLVEADTAPSTALREQLHNAVNAIVHPHVAFNTDWSKQL